MNGHCRIQTDIHISALLRLAKPMAFDLMKFSGGLIKQRTVEGVLEKNTLSQRFGLTLSPAEATELVEYRERALKELGRVEFGTGILDSLIYEFCDSPYINQSDYADTLYELLELFYYYKNETLDKVTDADLLRYMKECFDGECGGSIKHLGETCLFRLADAVRKGQPIPDTDPKKAKTQPVDAGDTPPDDLTPGNLNEYSAN